MQNYTARIYRKEDDEVEVYVVGIKCAYHVHLNKDNTILRGPGVYEISELDVTDYDDDMPETDLAIIVVLLFENGLWPRD